MLIGYSLSSSQILMALSSRDKEGLPTGATTPGTSCFFPPARPVWDDVMDSVLFPPHTPQSFFAHWVFFGCDGFLPQGSLYLYKCLVAAFSGRGGGSLIRPLGSRVV